jgi:hypothetical protein
MAIGQEERYFTSLVLWENSNENPKQYYSTLTSMAQMKKVENAKCWGGVEQPEFSPTWGGV